MISATPPAPSLLLPPQLEPGLAGASRPHTPADIERAARQFEAVLVRQLLTPVVTPLMQGGLGGDESGGGGIYAYMLTDTLATAMTQGRGLGLGEMFARQLASRTYVPETAAR
jgi:peptidoglycan hydrolase FlgJ